MSVQTRRRAVVAAEETAETAVLSHVATGAGWFICLAPLDPVTVDVTPLMDGRRAAWSTDNTTCGEIVLQKCHLKIVIPNIKRLTEADNHLNIPISIGGTTKVEVLSNKVNDN